MHTYNTLNSAINLHVEIIKVLIIFSVFERILINIRGHTQDVPAKVAGKSQFFNGR